MRKIATFLKEMLFPVKADALEATHEREEGVSSKSCAEDARIRAEVDEISYQYFKKYSEEPECAIWGS